MSKQILFNSDARKAVLSGINKVADATASTMGYSGRNVLISENLLQKPKTTKDGVSVSKSIRLSNPTENAAALLAIGVAEKTVELCGDGTTASIVIFRSIVKKSFEYIDNGANSVELKKGIEKATLVVIEGLKNQSIPVGKDSKKIKQIATVSANNDAEIGGLIANTFEKIGNDGIILIEEGRSIETKIRIDDGYQLDRGWSSPFWVTDKEKMICELKAPFILIVDGKIDKWNEIRHIMEEMAKTGKTNILIIADSVEGEAMDVLLTNKIRGILNPVIISAPSYGERRKQMMEDICILTNGHYISDDYNLSIKDANLLSCGTCEKVVVTKDTTTIVNGDGEKEDIISRSAQINSLIEQSDSDVEIAMLKQRLAKLNGGIAVFSVGGVTETEMKEKKDRVDDAIRATKCAIEEGIVAGGGIALLRCIDKLNFIQTDNKDQKAGVSIIKKSLEAPLRQMLTNAGFKNSKSFWNFSKEKTIDTIISELLPLNEQWGFNVQTEQVENLLQSGIIDPTKVVRTAFENAVSMACMVIISECLVVEMG